jgi:curved DNA-binding protein CbpA
MASRAQSLPNHYEVLGLSPTATQKEIAGAFAKAMGMFGARPVSVAAHIGHAFEVLRNPDKRRAYDRSIGLAPKPEPYQWQFAVAPQLRAPFIGSAMTGGAEAARPAFAPEPQVTPSPELKAPSEAQIAEAKLSSLIASLRELAEPSAPVPAREPFPQEQAQAPKIEAAESRPEWRIPELATAQFVEEESLHHAEAGRHSWKRPALVAGGLLVAAGLVGTVAGLSATRGEEATAPAVTVPLPAATQHPAATAPLPDIASSASDVAARSGQLHRFSVPARRPSHVLPQEPAFDGTEPQLAENQVTDAGGESESNGATADPLAPAPAAAQPVEAKLPLPKAVIARTIDRIGYACGGVASAAVVEGAPGVFNVTCTSGHSYRAAPVGGRYHFRKLGR